MFSLAKERRWVLLALSLLTACEGAEHGRSEDAQAADAAQEAALDAGADADAEIDAAEAEPPSDAALVPPDVSAPSDAAAPLRWQSQTLSFDTTPRTLATALSFANATESVTLRVSAASGQVDPNLCFALEEVWANGDQPWVDAPSVDDYGEFCAHCTQRVSISPGYGLFALPSNVAARSPLRDLRFRVALRECDSLLPWSKSAQRPDALRLEWIEREAAPEGETLALEVGVVLASEHGFVDGVRDAQLHEALSFVSDVFRRAAIELTWHGPRVLAPHGETLRFGLGDRAALDTLSRTGRTALNLAERALLVVLTPCLVQDDLLSGSPRPLGGYTPHLPGGFGLPGSADAAFIAVESCGGLPAPPRFFSAAPLGAVIAHELGHMLGLYHVIEADGVQDQLPDTEPSDANLMQRMPAADATLLSVDQMRVMRRHLALVRAANANE